MERLALLIATGAYCGYAPLVPGTVGAAVGLGLHLAARRAGWSPSGLLAVGAGLLVVGTWAATVAARRLGQLDPRVVVIDEVLGMWATLAGLSPGWSGLAVGFVLFRLFDVLKPYPAGRLEQLPGGWGIVADDLVAGLYAQLVLRAFRWAAPGWVT